MSSKPTINWLRGQIEQHRTKAVTGQYFITKSEVRAIFKRPEIDLAVGELRCDTQDRVGLATKISAEGTITFAILIWMGREDLIALFRNHEALDSSLPLPETRAQKIAPEIGVSFSREYQWQFLPYVFKHDMCDYHRNIDDDMLFPFIGEVEHVATGGYGEVSRVEILAPLQEFFPSQVNQIDNTTILCKR
jgi:hypothetical protein